MFDDKMYAAAMQAADHLEKYPQRYNFASFAVPYDKYGPACLWGWIGHFAGMPARTNIENVAYEAGVDCTSQLYHAMNAIRPLDFWVSNAHMAARRLRVAVKNMKERQEVMYV